MFADIADDWGTVSKEQIIERQIDLIVLVDAAWNTAEAKRNRMEADSVYRQLSAVDQQRYAFISFSASTPGLRIPEAVVTLVSALRIVSPRGHVVP